ncbi:MAG: hypothetical protein PQ612_04260 [Rickettsiales bacterium]|nr:hypothetical protein [Pseudomonadota bacterium]MDA0966173.1 hypothetical protein [Pseudomonadota bacterium]MDG4543162.1 hypothetical protein [Rickettsiales bacterium]MDG4545360.1 hypothetical protein [Rickettsiales bacterium]MDG4547809.1 hypothetical protein [Rickettsiales bacterium]
MVKKYKKGVISNNNLSENKELNKISKLVDSHTEDEKELNEALTDGLFGSYVLYKSEKNNFSDLETVKASNRFVDLVDRKTNVENFR